MTAQNLLSVVLPSSGHYCLGLYTKNRKQHVFTESIEEIESQALASNTSDADAYFALSAFTVPGSRAASNAHHIRSIFVDLDVSPESGNKYASQAEAVEGLRAFLTKTELSALGSPWLVSSGGGVHAYWPFKDDIPIAEWKPVAESFKRLAVQEGLHIDHTVTADAARVLRVPGTFNRKIPGQPREVTVLAEGVVFDFAAFSAAVAAKLDTKSVPPPPALNIPGDRPSNMLATGVKLLADTETQFKLILTKTKDGTGCKQLLHYVENAADEGMEPLWRGWLSIAQKCMDGEKASKWLSGLHPYDDKRMHQKLREIRGPYPCAKFDSENPGVCTGCKHWGKITNPLALGRVVITDNSVKDIQLPEDTTTPASLAQQPPAAAPVTRPLPPRGFSYGKSGGIYRDVEEQDAQKNIVRRQVLVLPYDLFVVDLLQHADGEHVVHLVADRPTGAVQVTLAQRSVISKDDTCKALAEQNVVAAIGAGNDKNLFDYVRACVESASVSRLAVRVPASYGWQSDGSFVFNERIYSAGAMPRRVPMLELSNINRSTQPKGTLDNWRKIQQLLINRGMIDVLSMGLVGFGSPLMRYTGFYGMTFHIGSTNSGTGKSLALELAASVWGHPVHYRVGKKTSDVAMQQRLGMLNSLPLVCDEITDKNRKDFEWFPAYLFDMTEGRGKERMEAGANKERLNLSTWQALSLMSSNTHVVDYLTGARKHSSEGELRRLLEMTMETRIDWQAHEIEIVKLLAENYGVAGQVFAQYMVDNVETCQRVVRETMGWLHTEFNATNDERFWVAGSAVLVAGAILCGRNYAAIIDYPIKAIVGVLRGLVERARGNVRASARSAEDVLNAFTRDSFGKLVVVKALNGALAATLGENGIIDETITRSQICGRVEHNVQPGFVTYCIEEQIMKAFCSGMSFGYADFKVQLERMYSVAYSKRDLLAQTRGPHMRVNCIIVTRPVTDDPLPA
jgi:hypothetical protein